ncbi:MAG: DNA polymerase III subunit delta [Thiohalocapsa sp.]
MKLSAGRVEAFLRHPDPGVRAVLLFGPDAGLVRERADMLARAICPDPHDPFRTAELTTAALAADPARLADEAAQIGLTGGRRVVRLREAVDALAPLLTRFLAESPGDALVVIEASDLPARSALRRVCEEALTAAAIGCYPDGARDLAMMIRDICAEHRIRISRDAADFLVEHLGGDRLLTRAELDKLTLYAGDGGQIALDDVRAVVADSALLSLDDALFAAVEGDVAGLDRALTRVFQEGGAPVTVIRALLRHLQRLHLLASRIAAGASLDAAMRAARPPIFFKEQDNWRRQLTRWSEKRLRAALARAAEAEFRMKLTGLPAETICREVMFALANEAPSPD